MGTDRETGIQTRTLVAIFRTSIHPKSGSRGPGTGVIFIEYAIPGTRLLKRLIPHTTN